MFCFILCNNSICKKFSDGLNDYLISIRVIQISMGGCVAVRNSNLEMLCLACQVFRKIDLIGKGFINSQDLTNYFESYSEMARRIVLRQIDLNHDGIITIREWIGYWELVRRAGYKVADIKKQLHYLQQGQLRFDFPNVKTYDPQRPRQTVLESVVEDLRKNQDQNIPIFLQI